MGFLIVFVDASFRVKNREVLSEVPQNKGMCFTPTVAFSRNCMALHGTAWHCMALHDSLRYLIAPCGTP